MTQESSQVEKAQSIHEEKRISASLQRERLYGLEAATTTNLIRQGKELSLVKADFENFMYNPEDLVHIYGFETFKDYRAAPKPEEGDVYGGLDMAKSSVDRAIKLYSTFVGELGFEEDAEEIQISYTKLEILCPVIHKGNMDDWLEKARRLSRSDLITEVAKELATRGDGEGGDEDDDGVDWESLTLSEKIDKLPGKNAKELFKLMITKLEELEGDDEITRVLSEINSAAELE